MRQTKRQQDRYAGHEQGLPRQADRTGSKYCRRDSQGQGKNREKEDKQVLGLARIDNAGGGGGG
jgi:hypothetical protein